MRVSALLAIFLVLAVPAGAGEPAKGAKSGEPGTNVEMPFLIAPVSVDGKLIGYSYISSKLVATSQLAAIAIRDKLAFIQDADVREVNAAPVGKASDPTSVDTTALGARLVAVARRIVGTPKVATIVFTQIQFSPLHPKATTDDATPPAGPTTTVAAAKPAAP